MTASCSPSLVLNSDTPSSFGNGKTPLCGISYPSSSPLSDIETCCDGPVQVYNGCLQYCFVQGDPLDFHACAEEQVAHDGPLASKCNFVEARETKQEIGRTKENSAAGRKGVASWLVVVRAVAVSVGVLSLS